MTGREGGSCNVLICTLGLVGVDRGRIPVVIRIWLLSSSGFVFGGVL